VCNRCALEGARSVCVRRKRNAAIVSVGHRARDVISVSAGAIARAEAARVLLDGRMDSVSAVLPDTIPAFELPRVLVTGTDLTTADATVGAVAIRLAMMLEVAVMLVHVLDTGIGDEPAGAGPNEAAHRALAARVRQRVEIARETMEAERARISAIDRDGHAVVRVTLADGRPWEMLVQLARDIPRAWILVGGRPGPTLLGHTSDHVLRHGGAPVLVVPDGCADTLVGQVVVAVDGSQHSTRALRAAGMVAQALRRPLEVLHVQSATDVDAPARIADQLRSTPADVATSRTLHLLVKQTSIAHAIAEHVRTTSTSMLIVGAGAGNGVVGRVLGSTAASLAHTSPVPVLFVR